MPRSSRLNVQALTDATWNGTTSKLAPSREAGSFHGYTRLWLGCIRWSAFGSQTGLWSRRRRIPLRAACRRLRFAVVDHHLLGWTMWHTRCSIRPSSESMSRQPARGSPRRVLCCGAAVALEAARAPSARGKERGGGEGWIASGRAQRAVATVRAGAGRGPGTWRVTRCACSARRQAGSSPRRLWTT
jgi:hypothetical protein